MALVEIEDVGTTTHGRLIPHRRLKVWEATGGRCVVCGGKIDGARERWIAEHIRALELGGDDDLANIGPAHYACAWSKTRDDHRRAAQAKRRKIQHLGAQASKRPLPCGKASPWKRKLSGQIVPR